MDVELDAVLVDRSESFDPRKDIGIFKKLVDEQVFSRPVAAAPHEENSLTVDKFNLLIKQIEYDVQVYETWTKKCSSVYAARDHAMQQWKLERHRRCTSGAQLFLDSCARLSVWEKSKPETAVSQLLKVKVSCLLHLLIESETQTSIHYRYRW